MSLNTNRIMLGQLLLLCVLVSLKVCTVTGTVAPTPNGCRNNTILPTSNDQTFTLSDNFFMYTSSRCDQSVGTSSKEYQYAYFTPPTTGNYYVRVNDVIVDSVLEMRTGDC